MIATSKYDAGNTAFTVFSNEIVQVEVVTVNMTTSHDAANHGRPGVTVTYDVRITAPDEMVFKLTVGRLLEDIPEHQLETTPEAVSRVLFDRYENATSRSTRR